MRKAPFIIIGCVILLAIGRSGAKAEAVGSGYSKAPVASNTANAPDDIPTPDNMGQILPVHGADLPAPPSTELGDQSTDTTGTSVVEAIPTPTAFHAGAVLLFLIVLGRSFRKRRWV
jgi:hypothetical protein